MKPEKTDIELEQIASNATTWEDEYKGYLQALKDVRDGKVRLSQPDSGWIPVSERLPEVGQRVLTYTCESPMTNEDQRVIVYGSIAFGFPAGVTHWQPLPEAPTTNP